MAALPVSWGGLTTEPGTVTALHCLSRPASSEARAREREGGGAVWDQPSSSGLRTPIIKACPTGWPVRRLPAQGPQRQPSSARPGVCTWTMRLPAQALPHLHPWSGRARAGSGAGCDTQGERAHALGWAKWSPRARGKHRGSQLVRVAAGGGSATMKGFFTETEVDWFLFLLFLHPLPVPLRQTGLSLCHLFQRRATESRHWAHRQSTFSPAFSLLARHDPCMRDEHRVIQRGSICHSVLAL